MLYYFVLGQLEGVLHGIVIETLSKVVWVREPQVQVLNLLFAQNIGGDFTVKEQLIIVADIDTDLRIFKTTDY